MHLFVVNIGGFSATEIERLEKHAKENGVSYDDQKWSTPDRKRAAIFAFALVGLGAAFTYHQQKEASSVEETPVPRSS